jgi:hypothetical protein
MRLIKSTMYLVLATALFGGGVSHAPTPGDPAEVWNYISSFPGLYVMVLEIHHKVQEHQSSIGISIDINRGRRDIANFGFLVPEEADKSKGLTVGFSDIVIRNGNLGNPGIADGNSWVIQFDGFQEGSVGESGYHTINLAGGVVQASPSSKRLDLLKQFLKHRSVIFTYWVKGEPVVVSRTLSDFRPHYAHVIKILSR